MTRAWRVREATPADFPAMNRLFGEAFAPRTLEHDHWRFLENPFGPAIMLVAEAGDQVVGQYGVWPTPMRLGSDVQLGAQCIDAATHRDYEGQGIFRTLASACHEIAAARGIVAIYAVPNTNSYFAFRHRLNFHHVVDLPRFTRLLDPARHPRVPRALAPAATLAARMLPRGGSGDLRIERGWPPASAIEPLLDQWREVKNVCRMERSPAWWSYRLGEHSGRRYECVTAWRGSVLAGLCVWAPDPSSDYPRSTLAELLFTDAAAGRAAVSAAVRAAHAGGFAVLNTATNDPASAGVLRSCGFLRLRPAAFIVRQLTARTLGANVHDRDAWRIFGADLDTL